MEEEHESSSVLPDFAKITTDRNYNSNSALPIFQNDQLNIFD